MRERPAPLLRLARAKRSSGQAGTPLRGSITGGSVIPAGPVRLALTAAARSREAGPLALLVFDLLC